MLVLGLGGVAKTKLEERGILLITRTGACILLGLDLALP